MATKVDELYVDVSARVDDYTQAMDRVSQKAREVGGRMQAIGSKMSAFITLPLAGVGAAALKTASEVEEMESKFNTVFGELAGEAEEFARRHARATGRAGDAIMGYMAQLQDTFVPMGIARQEAAGMSETLTALAVDVASFNNENPDEAVNAFTSALVGNHDAVRRYGVVMNQATLESELLAMGIEGGVSAASEQEKMLARMNVMLESTRDAQGDAQRTAGSFANQMKALQADVREVAVELGQMLMPAAQSLIGVIRGVIARIRALDESQKDLIVRLGIFAAAIPPIIVGLGTLIKVGGTVVAAFKAIGTAVAIAAAKITAPVVAAVAAVVTLGTSAWMIVRNWEAVKDWMGDFWDGVRGLAVAGSEMIVNLFRGIWPRVQQFVLQGIAKVYDILGDFFEWIGAEGQAGALREFGEDFREMVPEDAIEENNGRLAESAERFGQYKDDVVDSGQQAADGVRAAFSQIGDTISSVRDLFSFDMPDFSMGALGESDVDFSVSRDGEEVEEEQAFGIDPDKINELVGVAERGSQRMSAISERMSGAVDQMAMTITQGMTEAASAFAQGVGKMAAGGATMGDVLRSVMGTLISVAERVGKIAIGVGIAVEGIRRALQSLNPVAAIAAGTALLAVAGAARAALSSAAEGGGAGAGSVGGVSGRSGQSSGRQELVARVQGRDLLFVLREEESFEAR